MKFLLFALLSFGALFSFGQQAMSLQVGTDAPKIEAIDNHGNPFSLVEKLKSGPVAVVFYRGEWCSYCNRHMAELQEALPKFKELGVSVVAITPELPKYVKKTVKKTDATFSIISDLNHRIMDTWRVSFLLDETIYTRYKAFGINIDRASGNKDRVLPVPATYIVGSNGKIEALHFNPDYTERMPVSEMLEAVTGLK
ncbi:MAG: peroxiredoxin-like family protein [Flavobacteriales bacterium]